MSSGSKGSKSSPVPNQLGPDTIALQATNSHPRPLASLRQTDSYGVSGSRVLFQDNLTSVRALVLTPEDNGVDHHSRDDQEVARDTSPDARSVGWSITTAEDRAASDPTNAPEADERRRGECSLPLTADVVGLIRHDRGDPIV